MRTPQMNQMENKEVMAMKKEKMKRMGVVTRTRETIVMNPPKKKKSKIKKKYRMILRKSVKSSRSFMSKIRLWTILRSEEHTSELQSRGHLVCRLLLEIKNVY